MRIKQLLIAVCIGTMFAACSNTEEHTASEDNVIRLKAQIKGMKTKAAESSTDLQDQMFYNGEEVNVYLKNASTGQNVSGVESDYLTRVSS